MIIPIKSYINYLLREEFPAENNFKFSLEIPHNDHFGDLSTNILMIYGKKLRNFEEFKHKLLLGLKNILYIKEVVYLHPGFINIHLNPTCLLEIEKSWEKLQQKNHINISIEYASPNPTGPCHIGHARGSIIGDILVSVFKYLGYSVRKDCIFNDAGKQVEHFIESIFIRYEELNGRFDEINNIFYKGTYIIEIAKKYFHESLSKKDFFDKKADILEGMKKDMEETLSLLKVHHDLVTYESRLEKERIICWKILEEKNLLEPQDTPLGTKLLFKSTQFDDDKDRVIEREDGSATYFGNDIAYHFRKKNQLYDNKTFNFQIIILGDDHIGYLKRLSAAVKNLDIDLRVVTHNLVKLFKENQEIKMSKRNGVFVTIKEFLSKYANQDLLRILLIEHGYSSVINLNLDEIIFENSSLFYIQYAYTRVWSILNKISYDKNSLDLELLNNGEEKKLITILVFWPELIENITNNLEVHLILMYAKNLSKILHSYCTNYTIIQDNIPLQNARLYLMEKCLLLLTDIMNILKITILEKM